MLFGPLVALKFDYLPQCMSSTKRHSRAYAEGRRPRICHHHLAATALALHQYTGAIVGHATG